MHLFSGVLICEYFRVSGGTACLRAERCASDTGTGIYRGEIDCSLIATDNVFGTQNIFTFFFLNSHCLMGQGKQAVCRYCVLN